MSPESRREKSGIRMEQRGRKMAKGRKKQAKN
jgi:hypothetical protein